MDTELNVLGHFSHHRLPPAAAERQMDKEQEGAFSFLDSSA